jgi:hypothetical protein
MIVMIRKRLSISKKVMGDDTGSQVRNVISKLFMNGFGSGLLRGGQYWSVQLLLTNYNVETGVNDNAGSSIISREMDVGFPVHEPEVIKHDSSLILRFSQFLAKIIGKSSKIHNLTTYIRACDHSYLG